MHKKTRSELDKKNQLLQMESRTTICSRAPRPQEGAQLPSMFEAFVTVFLDGMDIFVFDMSTSMIMFHMTWSTIWQTICLKYNR